jgi:branched-chain amino acid transport system permease protein
MSRDLASVPAGGGPAGPSAVALTPARVIAIAIAGLALVAVPYMLPNYYVSIATQVLIFAVLAMSIDILAGYTGRTPLGHGAIFGTATYVTIYWSTTLGGSPWTGMLVGVAAATTVAAIFALLAIRTSGVYFLLLTLALGMIVWGVCLRWTSVTGGENGIRGSVRPLFIATHSAFYYLVLTAVAVITFVMWRFVNSPFGLTLRGIKDSESRMRSLGYNVPLHLFIAFTVSGFFAGIAGAIYAMFNSFVSPSTVALTQSVAGLLMAITGGIGTLFGSFVGAAAIISLENFVSSYTERWLSILGLMFVLIMVFAPEGIVGRIRMILARNNR